MVHGSGNHMDRAESRAPVDRDSDAVRLPGRGHVRDEPCAAEVVAPGSTTEATLEVAHDPDDRGRQVVLLLALGGSAFAFFAAVAETPQDHPHPTAGLGRQDLAGLNAITREIRK